jgi:tRNA-2-methylthio-N6-dimethylallyladenosine synthase
MTADLADLVPEPPATGKLKAFVPVILGCDFACTFCIVPSTRGPERSRPVGEVLGEVRALARSGTREVMLLGQTVDAYCARYRADDPPGAPVYGLADLIRLIDAVDGIERIRFTSPHPMLLHDNLIAAVAECPTACEWIHLPAQSGSDAVLKRMARRYNRARYLDRVRRIRAAMPDCAITTDLIVGFPGETELQFQETLSLVEEVRFDGAYMFLYSPRPGTAAFTWQAVPREVAVERLNRLIALQNRISLEKNRAWEGRCVEVLVEGPAGRGEGLYTGYSRENKTCHLPGHPGLVGRTVRARVARAAQWGFFVEPVRPAGTPLHVLGLHAGAPDHGSGSASTAGAAQGVASSA